MTIAQFPRALVAGGAGFVGSHLCRRLLTEGRRVICVDNLSTGQWSNLADLIGRPGFEFLHHDIVEPFDRPVDEIWNLACPASPPKYQADPFQTIDTCIIGSRNLLEIARRHGARVLFTSTSEVYGDPKVAVQSEGYRGWVNTTGPRACYDEGKRLAETLHYESAQRWGLRVRIARLFNTYGPRMDPDDGRVISNFVTQALRGAPLTVYGDGAQTRSFCYVDDTVEGLFRLMESEPAGWAPVNLGNPDPYRVIDLARRVLKLTGSKSSLAFRPLPTDDPMQRKPDISRAAHCLGWAPTVDLDTGLGRTIRFFAETQAAAAEGCGRASSQLS